MADIEKHFGRLITLLLLALFVWRVALSGQMLLDGKIASSVSKQYSKWRLFPSFTICLHLKGVQGTEILNDIDGNLRKLSDEVIISYSHRNVTETGWGKIEGLWTLRKIITSWIFRQMQIHNKTKAELLFHVGFPWSDENACFSYEPSLPTSKSYGTGVKYYIMYQ